MRVCSTIYTVQYMYNTMHIHVCIYSTILVQYNTDWHISVCKRMSVWGIYNCQLLYTNIVIQELKNAQARVAELEGKLLANVPIDTAAEMKKLIKKIVSIE